MIRRTYKNYFNFSTICIIAGGPHQDLLASRFMKALKLKDPNVNFIGIGGPLMESEGL